MENEAISGIMYVAFNLDPANNTGTNLLAKSGGAIAST